MEELEVAVKDRPEKLLRLTNTPDNAQWAELSKLRQSGDYAVYAIPRLQPFGVCVLTSNVEVKV